MAIETSLHDDMEAVNINDGGDPQSRQTQFDDGTITSSQAEIFEAMLGMKPEEVIWQGGLDAAEATRLVAIHRLQRQQQDPKDNAGTASSAIAAPEVNAGTVSSTAAPRQQREVESDQPSHRVPQATTDIAIPGGVGEDAGNRHDG